MKRILLWWAMIAVALALGAVLAGCTKASATTPTVVAPSSLTCTECHDGGTTLLAKTLQWESSVHATGGHYIRGTSVSCAGCHSSEGFTARIAAGLTPDKLTQAPTNPTPPNCRTCHQIHTTYTKADFARRTVAPFNLYVSGAPFNFGEGNLCAQCHQPRAVGPAVGSGNVTVDSRWGPHHGPQSASFLGITGYGVQTSVSPHYVAVKNGCPTCHMVNATHDMTPDVAACTACHAGATSFDIDKVQTDVKALLAQLGTKLEALGMLKNGSPVAGTYPEKQAGALWNYISVVEDRSSGVHNPDYIKAMLESGLEALK